MRLYLLILSGCLMSAYGYSQVPANGHKWSYGLDSMGRLGYQKDNYIVAKSYDAARHVRNIDTFDIITITADKINGDFKLDLSDVSSPDDTAMILVNTSGQRLKRVVTDYIDVKWFGAQGDGVTDDWYNLQRAIDWTVYHNLYPRKLVFSGAGTNYISSKGLFVGRIVTNDHYGFFSINITGEPVGCTYFGMESYVTQVTFTNPNEFGFGFQFCRASTIQGLIINGAYHCPVDFSPDGKKFYRTKFTDFYDGVCRTDRYSPHVGICTDPLSVNGTTPSGGGYSRFASYYTNYINGGGGCSGLTIKDVSIRNFVLCFGASISGTSANSENVQLETVEFREAIVGYSSGQDQEKENSVKHLTCWWPIHTVFDNVSYGAGNGILPDIDGVNIAGYCIRAFNINTSGYYSAKAKNIFAESILQVGRLQGLMNIQISDCQFDLMSNIDWPRPEWVLSASNTKFTNCTIREYSGENIRCSIIANNTTFDNCSFSGTPILLNNELRTGQPTGLKFINCSFGGQANGDIISDGGKYGLPGSNVYTDNFIPHGKAVVRYADEIQFSFNDAKYFRFQTGVETITLIADTITNKAKFYTPNTIRYMVGDIIVNDNPTGVQYDNAASDNVGLGPEYIGVVDSVLTDTIKLKRIGRTIHNGSSSKSLAFDRVVRFGKIFTGDVTSGSKIITNVVPYDVNNWPSVGYTMDWPTGSFNNTVYVTAVDTSAKTITVNWVSAYTQKGVRFFNGNPKVVRNKSATYYNTNASLFAGSLFADDEVSADVTSSATGNISIKPTFKVLTSGYINPAGSQKRAIIKNMYGKSVVDTSGNYSVLGIEDVVNVSARSGNVTVTLFPSTDNQYLSKDLLVKKTDSSGNTVTITAAGSDSLDGSTTVVLSSVYDWAYVVNRNNGKFAVYKPGSGGSVDLTPYALLEGRSGGQTFKGGTGTTDDLILQSTSGVGTTGADIIFKGGNNGATEFARFLNNGRFGLGTSSPAAPFNLVTTGQLGVQIDMSNTSDGTYAVNFNRASTSVENLFNWSTNGTSTWAFGQDNDGTNDIILYDWVANKYVFKATASTGDIAYGNSSNALVVKNDGSYVTLASLDTDNTPPSTSGGEKMVITDANGKLSFQTLPSSYTFTNGLTNTSGTITLGGTLTGATSIAGASNSMSIGTFASQLSSVSLWSSGVVSLNGAIQYRAESYDLDANHTIPSNVAFVELTDAHITTNRTITLPGLSTQGYVLTITTEPTATASHYVLASAVPDNSTGSTFTQLDWGKTYDFYIDASLGWRLIRKY